MRVHVLSLVGGSGLAGADGPYRLVCDYDFGEILGRKTEQSLYLTFHHIVVASVLALLKNLSHAEYGPESVLECKLCLGEKELVVFSEILAALAVAEYNIFRTGGFYHCSADLTGVCAFVVC